MSFLIPDTIQDSISFYLRAADQPVRNDSLQFGFGDFEYLPTNSQGTLFTLDSTAYETLLLSGGNEGLAFSLSPIVSGILFSMFLFCFVVFSILFSKEGLAFSGNFKKIFTSGKRTYQVHKEQVTTTEIWGEFFMIFQAFLLYTILLIIYMHENGLLDLSMNSFFINFLMIFIAIAFLAGLKYLMYRVISVFFLQNDMKNWIGRYYRLIELSGLILFIPLIAYVFLPESRTFLIYFILIILILIRLIVIIELLNIFVKNKVGGFYFFVYLCGTEIAPYLLFYKGVLSFISIEGNNIV